MLPVSPMDSYSTRVLLHFLLSTLTWATDSAFPQQAQLIGVGERTTVNLITKSTDNNEKLVRAKENKYNLSSHWMVLEDRRMARRHEGYEEADALRPAWSGGNSPSIGSQEEQVQTIDHSVLLA